MSEVRWWPTPKPGLLAAVHILGLAFSNVVPVSTRLPARNMPDQFIKVTRIGGRQTDLATDMMRLLVECYGLSQFHCEMMCNQARAAFRNSVGTTQSVSHNGMAFEVFIRGYGAESGPTDRPHPDILNRDRWEFQAELAVKAN